MLQKVFVKTFNIYYYKPGEDKKDLGTIEAKTRIDAMKKVFKKFGLDKNADIFLTTVFNLKDQKQKSVDS